METEAANESAAPEPVFAVSLDRWSAWVPEIGTLDEWLRWAERPCVPGSGPPPAVPFLPASLRRRCSTSAKMMLWAAFAVLDEDSLRTVPTVFGTQGGESATTLALLEELAQAELTSPMRFSLSVHNASAGLFSIAAKNRSPSTTVAAGNETFACALLETLLQQREAPTLERLLVCGDELLPEPLSNTFVSLPYQYGFALRLRGGSPRPDFHAAFAPRAELHAEEQEVLPQVFQFIRWLLSRERELRLHGTSFDLLCTKGKEESLGSLFYVPSSN